jgi:hypothetical protein
VALVVTRAFSADLHRYRFYTTSWDSNHGNDLIMASIGVQDLRRRLYAKAKSDFGWKRWSRQ